MKKVLVGGSFDLLHPGHAWFLRKSREYGDWLVVVVARDRTVKKRKGKNPIIPEDQRLKMVESLKPVDEAILGDEKDFMETVKKVKPDVIVLGYDQELEERILDRVLKQGIELITLSEKKDGDLLNTSAIIKKIKQER